jgi:hypothetical protein
MRYPTCINHMSIFKFGWGTSLKLVLLLIGTASLISSLHPECAIKDITPELGPYNETTSVIISILIVSKDSVDAFAREDITSATVGGKILVLSFNRCEYISSLTYAGISAEGYSSGKLPLIYICNFHVLSNLLLIYICKLHRNLNTMFVCQVNYF